MSSWSDRDAAVVPWITLRNSSSPTTNCEGKPEGDADIATASSMHDTATTKPCHNNNQYHNTRSSRRSKPNKILTLLSTRERTGQNAPRCGVRAGSLWEGVVVREDGLAGAGAWNPRRLQNMTLAIGPGTPAACVLPANINAEESGSDEEDDGGSSSEEDEEMFRADSEEEANNSEGGDAEVVREDEVEESIVERVMQDEQREQEENKSNGIDESDSNNGEEDSGKDDDSNNNMMEILPSDAEEGQEYHFDDSGRLVRDDNTPTRRCVQDDIADSVDDDAAKAEAETEIARQLGACITQSPGEQQDDDEDGEAEEDMPPRGSRRSHWEKRQQSILDALNGVGNDEDEDDEDESKRGSGDDDSDNDNDNASMKDDDDDESNDSHHTNIENSNNENEADDNDNSSQDEADSSQDSTGLTSRDRYNIRQVERYIDHLENLHRRRRERREEQAAAAAATSTSGPGGAGGLWGVYNPQTHMYEREVARSMKHGGCINTVSWLDCGWRISTVAHEDARARYSYGDDFDEDEDFGCGGGLASPSSSYSSNNYSPSPYVTPPRHKSRYYRNATGGGGIIAPLEPNEYPTQLLTSGDDHLVKFWDVAQSMGSTSPLPGGSATITPFSSQRMPMRACTELVDNWRTYGESVGSNHHRRYLPGVVHPLVTLSTGHRGNVFHATPVPHSLGKVATCAADGYLRLLDVEVHSSAPGTPSGGSGGRNRSNSLASASSSNNQESSTIVISPEYQLENGDLEPMYRFHQSLMCFSHHFLSANVGLVCSERGLLHFDIRLPPRSQKRWSLVPELSTTCKACFPWRLGGSLYDSNHGSSSDGGNDGLMGECESAYVFAGGSGVDVGLYDLRMTGSSSSSASSNQVVQKYRPRALRHKSSSVAVSGIDLSRDKRELLVSYESDHVYTFPIFDGRDCPTLSDVDGGGCDIDDDCDLDDIDGDGSGGGQKRCSAWDIDDNNSGRKKPVPELAAYGGHLNRLTFLKSAKYAGPNDEYICTGSDSGHAWIYEKQTGTVVSFIKADNSTCNGIQPHPYLPYFITYGIDSTAKLWRATTPVDREVDDSDLGRFNYSKRVKYEKSIIASKWNKARKGKEVDLEDDETLSFFPDETNDNDNDDPDHFLGVFIRSRFSQDGDSAPFIGNDLMNLNKVLAKNYFTCARSMGIGGSDDEPVKSGLAAMKRRVSLIKLRNQADRLGLEFNAQIPWILKPKMHLKKLTEFEQGERDSKRSGGEGNASDMVSYGTLADLIPDNPSDFIPFDRLLANPPSPGGMHFNSKYERYYLESSVDHSVTPVCRACPVEVSLDEDSDAKVIDQLDHEASKQPFTIQSNEKLMKSSKKENGYDSAQAWDILYQTVSLLKEAGNEALKASLPLLAARRYDKAINYCSIAYLEFPVGTVDFLVEHQYVISKNSGYECRWNELLKTLIMVRLNLAMVLLKEEISDAKGAVTQANLSLKELKPFSTEKGVVLTGKKLAKKRTDEPHSTYTESKALQAKAYFRLGSAQLIMNEYDEAVKMFEQCVDSTKEAGMVVDTGVLRKMNEAKRFRKEKKERQRKKFKFMFSSKNDGDETNS